MYMYINITYNLYRITRPPGCSQNSIHSPQTASTARWISCSASSISKPWKKIFIEIYLLLHPRHPQRISCIPGFWFKASNFEGYAFFSQQKSQSGWWFQPIWKNISQMGNLPQLGVKIKNVSNHHLAVIFFPKVFLHCLPLFVSPRDGSGF